MPVVVGQVPVTWSPDQNCAVITSLLGSETSSGDFVVLPEAALSGYDDELSALDDIDVQRLEDATDAVASAVIDRGVHLLCGSLRSERGSWRNTAIYFSPHGERWTYEKVNLARHERGRLATGSTLPILTVPIGETSVAVGVQLCREIRYPEQWHVLARSGAQLLAYLTYAANPREPAGVWRSHLISRAAETQRFVIAANIAHPHQHCPSVIISPRGEVIAEADTGRHTVLRCELDLEEVQDWYLSQQRSDVVAIDYIPGRQESARGGGTA